MTVIGYAAFVGCSNLVNITIPSSVRRIAGYAFDDCSNLTTVTILCTTPPNISDDIFGSHTPKLTRIIVPAGCGSTYQAEWALYADKIVEASN